MTAAAVFWDRDGTLIEDPGYLNDPEQVRLMPDAAEALRLLSQAGFLNILATNQSGVARGLLTEETLRRIHDRLETLLGQQQARLDAIYYCPFLPGEEAVVEAYRRESDLRKPAPGMLLKASLEHNLDLAASWSIGDSLRDAQAGRAAGCRTILISTDPALKPRTGRTGDVDFVASSPLEAARIVLRYSTLRSGAGVSDRPPTGAGGVSPDAASTLQEILAFLRTAERRARSEDYTLGRLVGAVLQIVAIGVLIWAVFAVLRNEPLGVQMVRLLLAVVLQLMAMTFFILDGRR